MSRDWRLYCRYRKGRLLWRGEIYANPDWVSMHLDGISSRDVWFSYAFTEKGIRHKLAKQLWRRSRPNPDGWRYPRRERLA